jgi:hypothetical protein
MLHDRIMMLGGVSHSEVRNVGIRFIDVCLDASGSLCAKPVLEMVCRFW